MNDANEFNYQIIRFRDISDFKRKVNNFLDGLDLNMELRYWHDYNEVGNKRYLPDNYDGYAAIYNNEIIGISYFGYPKKWSLRWLLNFLFPVRRTEIGSVIKKEYQKMGVASSMHPYKEKLAKHLGIQEFYSKVEQINKGTIKYAKEKLGGQIIDEDEKYVYFIFNLKNTK